MKLNKALINYLQIPRASDFIKHFYGISLTKKDIENFVKFSKVAMLSHRGLYPARMAALTGVPKGTVEKWVSFKNKPFPISMLEHYIVLGNPSSDCKWLSINSTRGGLFTGPWIEVPLKVDHYTDIHRVMNQLNDDDSHSEFSKDLALSYLLGMLVGDSSKTGIKRRQRTTRRIHLRLSRGYPTNEVLGEFVCECSNSLGLRMGRRKDCPAGKCNKHDFYTWISQSSMLVQWLFEICLGLKNDENTTYNPIRSGWLSKAPREFKIAFLQGLADSDGFVDFGSQQAGIITEPNTKLIKQIFDSLGIKSTPRFFTKNQLWALMISIKDAYALPLFSPVVKSYRYRDVERLYKAKRLKGHWPSWLKDKVEQSLRAGLRGTEIVKKILYEDGIAIRTKNIYRRTRILK